MRSELDAVPASASQRGCISASHIATRVCDSIAQAAVICLCQAAPLIVRRACHGRVLTVPPHQLHVITSAWAIPRSASAICTTRESTEKTHRMLHLVMNQLGVQKMCLVRLEAKIRKSHEWDRGCDIFLRSKTHHESRIVNESNTRDCVGWVRIDLAVTILLSTKTVHIQHGDISFSSGFQAASRLAETSHRVLGSQLVCVELVSDI